MKSYKELLNDWSKKTNLLHEMTDDERTKLQRILLDMYNDIDKLCVENGLTVMLGGGSCLGAVRHQGIIPWDDDLDLNMGRPDYDKLIELLNAGNLSDKYEFRYPDGKMTTRCAFLQIYKKGTIAMCFGEDQLDIPHGVYIDIFPIEGVPQNYIRRKLKGWISNSLRLIANCIDESRRSKSAMIAYKECPELYSLKKKRIFLGKMFSFIGSTRIRYWMDRLVADYNLSGLTTVPTGRNLYGGETQDASAKFPVIRVPFNDTTANIPKNYDMYLKMMYGDYMKMPPVEKRESHFYLSLKLD